MKYLVLLLSLHLLASCTNPTAVRFEVTQPTEVKTAKKFNRRYRGEYVSSSNPQEKLLLTKQHLIKYQGMRFVLHRKDLELDSNIKIDINLDEDLIEFFTSNGCNIGIDGDTIRATQTLVDTFFRISESQVLKKYRGDYYLNMKRSPRGWEVYRLDLNKGMLSIGEVTPSDSLLNYAFIEKVLSDSSRSMYLAKPSKMEFKRIVCPALFDKLQHYQRQKRKGKTDEEI